MSNPASEIEVILAAFADTWNRHDMDAFAALFAADAELVTVTGRWLRGRAEIHAAHTAMHASVMKESRIELRDLSIRVLGPDLAIARARWRLEGLVGPGGVALPPRAGVFGNLVARQAGAWCLLDTQNTEIADPPAPRP